MSAPPQDPQHPERPQHPLPARPGTVLFDLDGTILDSSRPVHAAWVAALEEMGLPPLPRDELHRVIGPPTRLSAPEILAERGHHDAADVEEFLDRFRTVLHETEVEQALAYPGVVDLLRALDADGRRLAIVTSKPIQSTRRVVPALGIDDLFVHLEGPDRADPEPKTVTMARAVAHLDVRPRDTVLVGDRHHDVESAQEHGIATIGTTWGGFGTAQELRDAGAATVVDTPDELARTLGLDPVR